MPLLSSDDNAPNSKTQRLNNVARERDGGWSDPPMRVSSLSFLNPRWSSFLHSLWARGALQQVCAPESGYDFSVAQSFAQEDTAKFVLCFLRSFSAVWTRVQVIVGCAHHAGHFLLPSQRARVQRVHGSVPSRPWPHLAFLLNQRTPRSAKITTVPKQCRRSTVCFGLSFVFCIR